jgi:hypothetical protein
MSEKRQGFNDWKPHEQFRQLALVGRPDGDMREGRSAFRAAILGVISSMPAATSFRTLR